MPRLIGRKSRSRIAYWKNELIIWMLPTAIVERKSTMRLVTIIIFCLALFMPVSLYSANPAQAQSFGQKNSPQKLKSLQAKAKARTKAATTRLKTHLKEKRQGKYGFPKDFNTVQGPSLQ